MKTLRMIGMVLMAVLMCVKFTSCNEEDDDFGKNPGAVYSGKKLMIINNITLHYDEDNRLIRYDYHDGDYVIFEYGKGNVFMSCSWNHSGTKAVLDTQGMVTTTECWCMDDDYCDKSEHPHYKSDDDWDFVYDDNKHLIRVGDYCKLEWDANGDLNKVIFFRTGKPMTFEYGSKPIENKMGFMLSYDAIWGLDLDSYDLFTIASLLGAGSKHLPISRSDGTTFEWELDVDGYPINLTINEGNESERVSFAWKAVSNILCK